jgi:hypothetical protein
MLADGIINVNWRSCNYFAQQHTSKMYGGLELKLHTFLTSTLYGGGWSDSHPDHLIPILMPFG